MVRTASLFAYLIGTSAITNLSDNQYYIDRLTRQDSSGVEADRASMIPCPTIGLWKRAQNFYHAFMIGQRYVSIFTIGPAANKAELGQVTSKLRIKPTQGQVTDQSSP